MDKMKKENKTKRIGLRLKLVLLFVAMLAAYGMILFVVTNGIITNIAEDSIFKKLSSDSKLGYSLLDQKYPGGWKLNDGKLYKGDQLINENYELVDEVKKQTGSLATIFAKDDKTNEYIRIATNVVKEDGSRAIGTKVSKPVQDAIDKGQIFTGEVTVVGKLFETEYVPIKDPNGAIVGIWFVGVEKASLKSSIMKLNYISGGVNVATLLISVIITSLIMNGLVKRIKKILGALEQIEIGDLTVTCHVKSNDEIKEIANGLNETTGKLRGIIQGIHSIQGSLEKDFMNISDASEMIRHSSDEISKTVQDIALGATQQAGDTNESLRFTNTLADKVGKMHDKAQRTIEDAEKMREKNLSGTAAIGALKEKFRDNLESTMKVSDDIKELANKSKAIKSILDTINTIAGQTNLLALNAAIEASRAGEAGRGFAVVADEIRKLAEQSANATNEIHKIINDITSEVETTEKNMLHTSTVVEQANTSLEETEKSFGEIIESTERVINEIISLKQDVEHIDTAKDSVLNSMESINAVTEASAASTQQISASVQEQTAAIESIVSAIVELHGQISALSERIKLFKV